MFKIKRNLTFRRRLVVCGYRQVSGVDFNERFAPVINHASFRIMLIAKLIWGLEVSIINLKIAFLHGELNEEIYLRIPEAMNEDQDHCLQTKKTIYGLVQSAREFNKKLILVIRS
jgi:hypothetical protein